MDGLFGLIWMVFIVVTLTNAITGKSRKNQKKSTSIPPVTAKPVAKPAEARSFPFQEWFDDLTTRQAASQPPQPETRPAPAEPMVHPHLAMDCDLDAPSDSMDFASTEGHDPCHDDELPSRSVPRPSFPVQQERPGLALEWNGDALVRSVIMQEVLTRPCQRKRR